MGSFSINIAAEPANNYDPTYNKVRQESCATGTTDYKLGVTKTDEGSAVADANYLLKNYNGNVTWDRLRISNLSYTNSAKFYLKYNGTKLLPGVSPSTVLIDIDISGVGIHDVIPLLFAVFNNDTFSRNETISFDLQLLDSGGGSLGTVNVGIIGLYVECIPPVEAATISKGASVNTGCLSQKTITVKVPSGGSKYVYAVESDGFCSISGISLPATITSDQTFTMTIDASNSGTTSTYSRIQIYVKESASSSSIQASSFVSRNHTGNIC